LTPFSTSPYLLGPTIFLSSASRSGLFVLYAVVKLRLFSPRADAPANNTQRGTSPLCVTLPYFLPLSVSRNDSA